MSSLSTRLGLRALLVAALYSCLLSAPTHAVTSNWNTDASGSFTTAANWDNGVPDSDDTAEFNRGFVAYTVTFPGNSPLSPPRQHVIDKLVVRTNEVGLVDNPIFLQPAIVTVAAFASDQSINIGEIAGDVAILNTTLSRLTGSFAWVGHAKGATGTFNVSSGTVSLGGGVAVGLEGTGTLNITGAGHVSSRDLSVGISLESSGTVTVRDAGSSFVTTSQVAIGYAGTATLNVSEGGAVTSESGIIGLSHSGTGTVHVDGSGSMWTNSQDLSVGYSGTGMLHITSGGKVSSAQATIGTRETGYGAVTISGEGSAWTNPGEFVIGGAGRGSLLIMGGADLASDNSIIAAQESSNSVASIFGAGSTWTNTGNLTVGGLGTATLNVTGGGSLSNMHAFIGTSAAPLCIVTVEGAGSTWHSAGDLTIGRLGSGNSGTLILSDGGVASVDGLLVVEPTGVIAGNGMADTSVINRGDVRPGLLASTSSGALHVDGSYLQSQTGRLTVRLGGTMPAAQYDQLQVTGAVTLSGTLSVVLANSFTPSAGNDFNIIDGNSISGTFSTIQVPALAAGLTWNTSHLYTTGVLSVVSAGLPGDYNYNGTVDAADYTIWRDHLGQSFPLSNENPAAATPGVVDAEDYAFWKSHFGESLGSGSGATANATVPEPATLVLLMLAAIGWCVRRSRDVK